MDGLGRAAGSPVVIRLAGKDYKMSPLTLRDFGTIEQHLLTKRPNILKEVAAACSDLPEDIAKQLMDRAYEDAKKGNTIPAAEVAEWVDSFDGMCFSIWLSLSKEHKDITQDEVMQLLSIMGPEELEQMKNMRDVASGVDELGN